MKRLETRFVMIIFMLIELALCSLIVFQIVTGNLVIRLTTDQLIICGFSLGFLYILYVELRAKRFSEYLVDEKVKTHTLLEALPEGAFILDRNNLLITANKKGSEVLNINILDHINRDFTEIVDDASKALIQSNTAGMITAKGVSLNVTPLKGQGKLVTVDRVEETARLGRPRLADPSKLVDAFLRSVNDYKSSLFSLKIKNFFEEETVPAELAKENVNVKKLIDDGLVELCNLGKSKGVKINVKVDDSCQLYADRRLVQKAVNQLLLNAVTYAKDSVDIIVNQDRNDVQIQIGDNGIGIEESDIPKVFDIGFVGHNQIEETKNGRGIGLFVAKKVIDAHGGSIWIESRSGVGTRVSFNIPKS